MGPSGFGSQRNSPWQQREDDRLSSASTVEPAGLRRSEGVETGAKVGQSICLSESAQAWQAYWECQTSMADGSKEVRCAVFPDLQFAARILHAIELGRSRCGAAASSGIAVQRRNATISLEWLTRLGRALNKPTNEPMKASKKYYVFITVGTNWRKELQISL